MILKDKIYLHLRNPRVSDEKLVLEMNIFDTNIGKRWIGEMRKSLQKNLHLEKTFCFLGFLDTHRDLNFLTKQLNKHIKVINDFQFKTSPYHIDLHFTPEKTVQDGVLNQELMNDLHHHFATLFGQVWNISPYYKEAPESVQASIVKLNYLCHELENHIEQKKYAAIIGEDNIGPSTIISFYGADKMDLHEEDYDHFRFRMSIGGVYMHYCQVGKRWDEAFEDRDKVASSEEISGLRYYSGEFDVFWGLGSDKFYEDREMEIKNWLRSIGKDPEDKKLSLGWLQVGEFNREKNFGDKRPSEIHRLISRHSDVEAIRLVEADGTETIAHYPYCELDEDYENVQTKVIGDTMK